MAGTVWGLLVAVNKQPATTDARHTNNKRILLAKIAVASIASGSDDGSGGGNGVQPTFSAADAVCAGLVGQLALGHRDR